MKILPAIGALFAVIGLACGFLLLYTPLMVPPVDKSLSLSVLTSCLYLAGILLASAGGKASANLILRIIGMGMMLQSVLAVLGLVGDMMNVLNVMDTWLWWVMAGGCLCGGALALLMAGNGDSDPETTVKLPQVKL